MITGKDHTEIKTQKMIQLSRKPLPCFLDSEERETCEKVN